MEDQRRRALLAEYMGQMAPTDRLPTDVLQPVLFGLFGEVGEILATAKKLYREKGAYTGYRHAVVEEFGDALWYLAALCRRLKIDFPAVFREASSDGQYTSSLAARNAQEWPVAELYSALLKLGEASATLLSLTLKTRNAREALLSFAKSYLTGLQAAEITVAEVIEYNVTKTLGRFVEPDHSKLPTFDEAFDEEERIPSYFEITITQRKSGKSYLQWNGVFIGDPLTDNIFDQDGYRFHDVFHLAHASVLHWSPTFRALIKHKRKSDPKIDEAQDGGRATVVEEGLTVWIFSRAKDLNLFENHKSISFDILKTIQQFVRGYEVDACPLRLWEDAILQGYEVFRNVREQNGGTVIGDRANRRIRYQPTKGR